VIEEYCQNAEKGDSTKKDDKPDRKDDKKNAKKEDESRRNKAYSRCSWRYAS
jgi:hypothetical protein